MNRRVGSAATAHAAPCRTQPEAASRNKHFAGIRHGAALNQLLLEGAAVPGSVELDLARRYGGKVRSGTATTCRFLLEAPPLGYVVQRGAGHGITRVSDCMEKPGKGFYGLPLKGIRSLAQWRGVTRPVLAVHRPGA